MSPDGAGGYRVEADGCALSQRAIDGVAQVEEPGERGGAPGARGGVALIASLFQCTLVDSRGQIPALSCAHGSVGS